MLALLNEYQLQRSIFTLDVRKDALNVGHAALLNETLDGTADHGVLAHEDDGVATEGNADLVHLLGGDIVNGDDEDGLVGLEQRLCEIGLVGALVRTRMWRPAHLQLIEVRALGSVLSTHFCGCVIWPLVCSIDSAGCLSQIESLL
jgi:hypothetical protein